MMATHVYPTRDAFGELSLAETIAGGRASALFAVLAGVSLALMTGRSEPVVGTVRRARSVELAVRALLIAALGMVLGALDSGLAIILTYYGLLFLLGIPFLGLRARTLALLAILWLVAAPVLSQVVRPGLPDRGYASPVFEQLSSPWQLTSELLFTGYYPVVPWLAYLFAGMAVGRMALSQRRVQAGIAVVGGVLASGAFLLSRFLTEQSWFADAVVGDPLSPVPSASAAELVDTISSGMFGTTPTGGPWEWLVVVAPHSATPFDLAHTLGTSLLVIGLALLVVGTLSNFWTRAVAVFFGAGTMTLTLYSLHVVMRTDLLWPPERPDTYVWHVLVVIGIGAGFVAAGARGPLEAFVSASSKGWASKLVRTDEPSR